MVIACPKCQARLKLSQVKCRQCQNVVEIDKNLAPGRPAVVCPQCGAEQPISRLKCNKCQTVIDLSRMKPAAPAPAASPAAAPVSARPLPAAAPAAPDPSPDPPSPQAAAGMEGVPVFKNSPAMVIVLALVTCGFYMLFWSSRMAKVLNAITPGRKIGPVMAILTGLNLCWPATVKYYWRAAKALGLSRPLMVVLAFIPIVAAAVVQSKINQRYEGGA